MQQNQTIIMFFKMTKTNTTPWDGVMTGAGAQEESLFRRTTFFVPYTSLPTSMPEKDGMTVM